MSETAAIAPFDARSLRALAAPAAPAASRPNQLAALDMQREGAGDVDRAVGQFRDIFLGFMVQAMRDSVPDMGPLPRNTAEKMFESFLDREYVKAMGEQMGDDMITEALRRQLDPRGGVAEKPAGATHAEIEARARSLALPPLPGGEK